MVEWIHRNQAVVWLEIENIDKNGFKVYSEKLKKFKETSILILGRTVV